MTLEMRICVWIVLFCAKHYNKCYDAEKAKKLQLQPRLSIDWLAVFWLLILWEVGLAFKYIFAGHRLIVAVVGFVIGVASVWVGIKSKRSICTPDQGTIAGSQGEERCEP